MPKIGTLTLHSIDPDGKPGTWSLTDRGSRDVNLCDEDGEPMQIALMYSSRRLKKYGSKGGFYAKLPEFVSDITGKKEVEAETQGALETAVRVAVRDYVKSSMQRAKVIGIKIEREDYPGRLGFFPSVKLAFSFVVAVKVELGGSTDYFEEEQRRVGEDTRTIRSRINSFERDDRVWIEHTDEREQKLIALREAVATLGKQIAAFVGQTDQGSRRTGLAPKFSNDERPEIRAADADRVTGFLDGVPLPALQAMSGTLALPSPNTED